jgi:hypothetical protein
MRLSEWRAASPSKEAGGPRVAAVVDPILRALGAAADPVCWVAWGEEPGVRHSILLPTPAGLVTCFVRVSVPGEGPRASAKLVRWSRVQLGELAIETQGSHRLLSFQVEGQVLNGADETADRVAAFALELFASMDGRPAPEPAAPTARRTSRPTSAGGGPAKPARAAATSAGVSATKRTATGASSTGPRTAVRPSARSAAGLPAPAQRRAGSSR